MRLEVTHQTFLYPLTFQHTQTSWAFIPMERVLVKDTKISPKGVISLWRTKLGYTLRLQICVPPPVMELLSPGHRSSWVVLTQHNGSISPFPTMCHVNAVFPCGLLISADRKINRGTHTELTYIMMTAPLYWRQWGKVRTGTTTPLHRCSQLFTFAFHLAEPWVRRDNCAFKLYSMMPGCVVDKTCPCLTQQQPSLKGWKVALKGILLEVLFRFFINQ